MSAVLPYHGQQPLEIPILVLFAILFGWVSAGFWTAIAGFVVLRRGGDRCAISRTRGAPTRRSPTDARTAIIMPIAQRGRRARVRADCARPTSRSRARGDARPLRLLRAVRHAPIPTRASPRSPRGSTLCRAGRRLRPHLLSLAPAPHQAQERQRRRLLPPLGHALSLHGRARRRQRDDRRLPRARSCSSPRPIPTPASSRRRRARPAATRSSRASSSSPRGVYGPLFTAGLHLLAARRIALLGPQRDHPRRAVHRSTARSGACPARGSAVGRDPVARFRRGGADAARRLGRVDRLRPARQLRGDAAQPDRRAEARPPLVPGQPDELRGWR